MAVVVFDDAVMVDFAAPLALLERVALDDGSPGYETRLCAVDGHAARCGGCTISVPYTLRGLHGADTILVPGHEDVDRPIAPALVRALAGAADRGARIVSLCTGAFVLAACGLLDGRRATTHWAAAGELARRYPSIEVDPNVLYVDGGQVLTSAGASAATDLCLHLVRSDHGAAAAARAARLAVVPLERAGGQAQFVEPAPGRTVESGSLEPLLRWIERHPEAPLDARTLARRAATSVRTLNRRFAEQTGTTPGRWVLERRLRAARSLLETSGSSIEAVAERSGFGTACSLRERFRSELGTTPRAYRQAFRSRPG